MCNAPAGSASCATVVLEMLHLCHMRVPGLPALHNVTSHQLADHITAGVVANKQAKAILCFSVVVCGGNGGAGSVTPAASDTQGRMITAAIRRPFMWAHPRRSNRASTKANSRWPVTPSNCWQPVCCCYCWFRRIEHTVTHTRVPTDRHTDGRNSKMIGRQQKRGD